MGIWRLIEIFDRHGIRPSVLLNSEVAERYPQVIQAGLDRGWAWLAHGRNNSTLQTDLGDDERDYLLDVLDTIEKATGQRPSGWLGPALTETFRTPELLAELGVRYTLDWTNDDQPYPLRVPGLHSVPYSVELNDIPLFVGKSLGGAQFVQIVKDQARPTPRRRRTQRQGDGAGAAPVRDGPAVPGQISRRGAAIRREPSRCVGHHIRRDLRALPCGPR